MGKKAETTKKLKLEITFFDTFQIVKNDEVFDENDIRSDMVTKLLAYLLCHRKDDISTSELMDVLWHDDKTDGPVGALKTLMYRLRAFLKNNVDADCKFILTGHGTYRWNDEETNLVVDTEQFEHFCWLAEHEENINKRIEFATAAESLYKEKFLPEYIDEYWVMSLNVYYHSLYLNMVKRLAEDLGREERFYEMEEACHNALGIDELDEDLQYYYLQSLMRQNKNSLAIDHFNKISEMFYDSLGVRPSDRIRVLYDSLLKQQHKTEMDITKIKVELNTGIEEMYKGAFLCEYGVFKKNYELEIRRAKRQGMSVYLGLITVSLDAPYAQDSQAYKNAMNMGIRQTQNVLMESLRAGDVITRYSVAQFIIMLPTCTYEDARRVMRRVVNRFSGLEHRARVRLSYSLDELSMG